MRFMRDGQPGRSRLIRATSEIVLALLFTGALARASTETSFGEPGGDGGGPFGGLQQSAEANLYTGAFTLSVPIVVPPGRPQVTPDLKLKYSSSDGDGPFGRGWTLPLGQIQRNTKNGVPRCTGTPGFDFTDDFVLVLAGNTHELVLKAGNSYRPMIDTSFVEATKDVSGNTWELVDRGGRRYRFGTTSESRLLNSSTCSFTSVWGLTEIEDPYGNLIQITYASAPGSLVPEKIEYGGTAGTVHPFQVRFIPIAHPYPVTSYRQGVKEVIDHVVGQIVVEARLSQGANFTPVRTYTLAYNHQATFTGCANAHNALLCQVSANDGRPVQSFEYATSAFGMGLSTDSQGDPGGINSLRAVNGSGDTVRSVMDMDGDGFTDLVDSNNLGNSAWGVHYGNASGISNTQSSWSVPGSSGLEGEQMRVQTGYSGGFSQTRKETIDMTGDGIPDFVDATTSSWKVFAGYCSTTCGFSSSYTPWSAPEAELGENEKTDGGNHIRVWKQLADMNGDGRPDLVIANSSQWLVYLNKGNGFASYSTDFTSSGPISQQVKSTVGSPNEWRTWIDLFDFNGDGLPDKVVNASGGNAVYLNNGQGFDAGFTVSTLGGTQWVRVSDTNNEGLIDYVDVNGDGLPDRVVSAGQASSTWQVQINRGTSLASSISWPGGPQGPIRDLTSEGAAKIDLIDYNGDGFMDRVDASGSTWQIKLGGPPASSPKVRPFLLLHARNGLGGDTHVRYAPSTNFVNQVLPFIVWTTTGIRRTDGICTPPANVDLFSLANTCIGSGNELVQTHAYEGGLWHGGSREFRGFQMVVSTDPDGSSTEVTYSQADFKRGMKLLEETITGAYTVTRDTYDWGTQADGLRTQVYLKERKRELLAVPSDPLLNQCSYDRNVAPDAFGRISTSCSLDCTGAPATPGSCANPTAGQITTTTTWANPQTGSVVRERPSSVKTEYTIAAGGPTLKVIEKTFRYDGADLGSPVAVGFVNRGALTWIETYLDESPLVLGTPSQPVVLQQVDSFGNVTLERDPLGHDTTFNYAGSPYSLYAATTTNALGHVTGQTMNLAYGKPSSETGPNVDVTSYAYDAMGRLTCEALPGDSCSGAPGGTRTYSYVPAPGGIFEARLSYVEMRLKEPKHASGYRTSRVYSDALGRERLASVERILGTGTTLSTVVVEQKQFDEIGRLERAYAPYEKLGNIPESPSSAFTAYDYNLNGLGVSDPLGRPHIVTPPDGNATTASFKGRRTQIFDPLNNETRIEADAFGREVTRDLYDQGTLKMRQDYTYDGLGRIRGMTVYKTPATRGAPATVAITYDTLGREIHRIDPDSGFWRFGYDAAGNLVFEDYPKSGHVQACYDSIDRITKRYVFLTSDDYDPNGCSQASPESTYSYDSVAGGNAGKGRLTAVSDPSGSESWVYDLRGNVTSDSKTVLGKTAVMDSSYDAVDRLLTLTYFGTEQVTYDYRADGQFKSLVSSGATYVSDAGYDLFGRLELLRHGNGTDDSVSFYGASENFRPERITTVKSGVTTPYLDLQYQYNSLGQVERIDDLRNPTRGCPGGC